MKELSILRLSLTVFSLPIINLAEEDLFLLGVLVTALFPVLGVFDDALDEFPEVGRTVAFLYQFVVQKPDVFVRDVEGRVVEQSIGKIILDVSEQELMLVPSFVADVEDGVESIQAHLLLPKVDLQVWGQLLHHSLDVFHPFLSVREVGEEVAEDFGDNGILLAEVVLQQGRKFFFGDVQLMPLILIIEFDGGVYISDNYPFAIDYF